MTDAHIRLAPANTRTHYVVTRTELPLHCPTDAAGLWSSHQRVFLPVEETGRAKCPYCGAEYVLRDGE